METYSSDSIVLVEEISSIHFSTGFYRVKKLETSLNIHGIFWPSKDKSKSITMDNVEASSKTFFSAICEEVPLHLTTRCFGKTTALAYCNVMVSGAQPFYSISKSKPFAFFSSFSLQRPLITMLLCHNIRR